MSKIVENLKTLKTKLKAGIRYEGMCVVMHNKTYFTHEETNSILKELWKDMPEKITIDFWGDHKEINRGDYDYIRHSYWFPIEDEKSRLELIDKTIERLSK